MSQTFFIIGCGKMGSALLRGWLSGGAGTNTTFIIVDPYFEHSVLAGLPGEALRRVTSFSSVADAAKAGFSRPDVMLLSVKPQMMADALSDVASLDISHCCFISIAAGLSLAKLSDFITPDKMPRLIRTMPNTPAAIGKGITAMIGNQAASTDDMDLAEKLLSVCGTVVRLEHESQLDAVTALSGSGPAYVFLLAEAMAQAGQSLGLSQDMSNRLAIQTVAGAGALLDMSEEDAASLRQNVTSKGGTTAAALAVLMADEGMSDLLARAMKAAHARSEELGQ